MEPNIPPPKPSAVQGWLMVFCWLVPGLSALGAVTLSFVLSYSRRSSSPFLEILDELLLLVLLALLIGSGIFASILRITRLEGSSRVTPRTVAGQTFLFCLAQIFVTPVVAFSFMMGCGAVSSIFS
ncbi:hypothetical protein AAFN60_03025 [Roseibacillus persicicus]|uniref:hypothetical protein n=1 Tax=Roseibacillus persicicus TaxID=454148 RepID=UPI00398B9DAE